MSTAIFLKSDSATQGAWYSGSTTVYGHDGYAVIGQGASGTDVSIPTTEGDFNYPSYASVTLGSGTSGYCWAGSTSTASALEYGPPGTSNGSDSKRVAAAWYESLSFTIEVTDGSSHQIALYFLDWDAEGREQQIQITDNNNDNAVLDTRTISSFQSGLWMVWNVSGSVTFTISLTGGGHSAAVSGLFFDTPIGTLFPPLVSRPRFEPAYFE